MKATFEVTFGSFKMRVKKGFKHLRNEKQNVHGRFLIVPAEKKHFRNLRRIAFILRLSLKRSYDKGSLILMDLFSVKVQSNI